MKIEIRISGLAIFYRIGNLWQVVFVCDTTHPVNFKHGNADKWTALSKYDKDRDISVYVDKPVEPTSPNGDNFNQILNMACDYMHGKDKVKIKRSGIKRMVFMTIPSAKLDCQTPTEDRYYVASREGETVFLDPVAKTVKATIELEKGNGLTMIIKDSNGTSLLASVPYNDVHTEDPYLIEFYNDCGAICNDANDFLLFYDWLKDTNDESKFFLAGKSNGQLKDRLEGAEKSRETVNVFDGTVILSSENGNCDPVVIDPPPTDTGGH